MKGLVKIYLGDKLLAEESNLVVDGASELLADIFTMSPSLSSIPSASAILDASNYTIKAISYGKARDSFTENAHVFSTYNWMNYGEDASSWTYSNGALLVSTIPDYGPNNSNVFLISNGGSSTAIATVYLPASALIVASSLGPWNASLYVKNHNSSSLGVEYTLLGNNFEQKVTVFNWTSANVPIHSLGSKPHFIQDAGDGWYRISYLTSGSNGSPTLGGFVISPHTQSGSGAVFIHGIQVERGPTPTVYVKPEDNVMRGLSNVQVEYRTRTLADRIIRVVQPLDDCGQRTLSSGTTASGIGVSSFYANPRLPEAPSPLHTQLQRNVLMPVASSLVDSMFTVSSMGHNLNYLAFNGDIQVGPDTSGLVSSISALAYYVGAYPASAGTTYYILSSLDSPDNPLASGIVYSLVNKLGIADIHGFITDSAGTATSAGLVRTVNTSLSGTQTITYSHSLSGPDLVMLGLFGNITEIGLWTLDLKRCVREGRLPPYGFNPLTNPRRYRLFAKKSFNRGLIKIEDTDGVGGYKLLHHFPGNSGFDLRVIWDITL